MSQKLANIGFLLLGATLTCFVEYYFVSEGYVPKLINEIRSKTTDSSKTEGNLLSGTGKTKVYRFDGKRLVRLREFCTWTVHMDCVMLKTTFGPTPVHIHDPKVDKYLSVQVKKEGTWETGNIQLIIDELKKDPELGFMDLGSHVGVFSLSVAKFGRKVVSVDPVVENVQRLCSSVQKGGFTKKMIIVFNPLSDEHKTVSFSTDANNVGATNVIPVREKNGTKSPCEETADSPTVMLDDLIHIVPFRKAVMKMDVQEHEYRVLKGAFNFFKQVNVTVILMEWVMIKLTEDGSKLVTILLKYGFKAYEPLVNGKELDPKSYKKWPYDVMWRRS